jgi:hypothetical protein
MSALGHKEKFRGRRGGEADTSAPRQNSLPSGRRDRNVGSNRAGRNDVWLVRLVSGPLESGQTAKKSSITTPFRRLATRAEWRILDQMQDLFACRECQTIYAVTRVNRAPILPPLCRSCGCKFPPSELGDWLVYEHVDLERTVDAWLREALETEESVMRAEDAPDKADQAVGELETNSTQIAVESMTPSTRLLKLAPFVVRI